MVSNYEASNNGHVEPQAVIVVHPEQNGLLYPELAPSAPFVERDIVVEQPVHHHSYNSHQYSQPIEQSKGSRVLILNEDKEKSSHSSCLGTAMRCLCVSSSKLVMLSGATLCFILAMIILVAIILVAVLVNNTTLPNVVATSLNIPFQTPTSQNGTISADTEKYYLFTVSTTYVPNAVQNRVLKACLKQNNTNNALNAFGRIGSLPIVPSVFSTDDFYTSNWEEPAQIGNSVQLPSCDSGLWAELTLCESSPNQVWFTVSSLAAVDPNEVFDYELQFDYEYCNNCYCNNVVSEWLYAAYVICMVVLSLVFVIFCCGCLCFLASCIVVGRVDSRHREVSKLNNSLVVSYAAV